jgi:hypothetical protein
MRPKIICHMMSSIDGRLFVDRWTAPAAGIKAAMFRGYYEEVASHFQSDDWIVGRKTMEEIIQGNPRIVKSARGDLRATNIADRKGRNVAVAIDPHGKLHYGQDNAGGDHIIAVLSELTNSQQPVNRFDTSARKHLKAAWCGSAIESRKKFLHNARPSFGKMRVHGNASSAIRDPSAPAGVRRLIRQHIPFAQLIRFPQ